MSGDNMELTVDTGKWKGIVAQLNAEEQSVDAILEQVGKRLKLFDIYHRAHGWIDAQIFKVEVKEKQNK